MTTLRRGDQIFGTGSALAVSDVIVGTADEAEFAASPSWILRSGALLATIDIDFVNNLAWNADALTSIASLLACSRASSGYYTNAAGTLQNFASNTLRYGSKGLLVEETRTNRRTRSQDFSHADWGPRNLTIVADATAAPDGTTTADLVYPSSSGNSRRFQGSASGGKNGVSYAVGVYAKYAGIPWIYMFEQKGDDATWFNIQTGVVGHTAAGCTPFVEALADGWYRIGFVDVGISAQDFTRYIGLANADNSGAVTASGTSGIYLWGGQDEVGVTSLSSYIPNTTGTTTRNADIVTFSDLTWLSGVSDSIYAEWIARNVNNAKVWAFDATNDKLLDEQTGMSARIAGATVANTVAAGATVKAAASMGLNDFAISMNGGTVATDVSETAPGTLTASRLGIDLAGADALNGYIRRGAVFKGLALNGAALQALTA